MFLSCSVLLELKYSNPGSDLHSNTWQNIRYTLQYGGTFITLAR